MTAVVEGDKGPSPYRLKARMTAAYLVNLRRSNSVSSICDWWSVNGIVVKLYDIELFRCKISVTNYSIDREI